MTPHKYTVGQKVKFIGFFRAQGARGDYEITRLLPPEGTLLQYRLKALDQGQERVAREDQLDPSQGQGESQETPFFRVKAT